MQPTTLPNATVLTHQVLRFLADYKLTEAQLQMLPKRPAGAEQGLLTIESQGVRATTDAFWWSGEFPYLVVAILGLLGVPILNRTDVIAWIKREQAPSGVFRKGKLGDSVRTATYNAAVMLHLLGGVDDEVGWNRVALVAALRAQQQPTARRQFDFLPSDLKSFYAELEIAQTCIGSLAALGATVSDREAAIHYLQAKQRPGGAFERGQVKDQGYSYEHANFDAIRALALLDAQPREVEVCVAAMQAWQIPDGAFDVDLVQQPGYPKQSQLSRTSYAVLALYLLGAAPRDTAACLVRLSKGWVDGGYIEDTPGEGPLSYTLSTTHKGLLALAVLGALPLPGAALLPLVTLAKVGGEL